MHRRGCEDAGTVPGGGCDRGEGAGTVAPAAGGRAREGRGSLGTAPTPREMPPPAVIGMWDWDPAADVLGGDDSLYAIHGTSRADFAGTLAAFAAAFHPDDRGAFTGAVARSLADAGPWPLELRLVRPDGVIEVAVTAAVVRHGERVVRVVGACVDLTAQRRVEAALRDSEERFAKAFGASPLALAISSLRDGRLIEVNQSFVELSGYSREEAIGRTTLELGLWTDPEARERELAVLGGAGSLRDAEHRLRTRSGAERIGLLSAERIEIRGEPCALTVIQDVTERRRMEHATARLAAIVDSSDDAIVGKTLAGIVTSWNRGAECVFGYTAEEMIGQSIARLVPPDRPDEVPTILARIRRGERVDHYETQRVRKDGRRIHVSLTVSPIRDAAGGIVGASKIGRDVSDRRRAEEEREHLLAAAEQRRAEAEAANRAKDQFLSMVSHELRTPLASIMGWVEVLRRGKLSPDRAARALDTIARSGRLQSELIEDLLDVSRIVSGRLRLEIGRVDVRAVVEAAVDAIGPDATAAGLQLDVALDAPRDAVVEGDPIRLEQVVSNVLGNAVRYTPSGGNIEVRLEAPADLVRITVRDSGRGIAADFLPHVFDAFRQAESVEGRKTGGLGLGLAIARALVERHHGTIEAASEGEGRGATFKITLPRRRSAGVAEEAAGVAEEAAGGPGRTGRGRLDGIRVLIVDDQAAECEALRAVLEDRGAVVAAVGSVREARHELRRATPDVLVSDIRMPEEDGYVLLRELRAQGQVSLPVLAVTGDEAEPRDRAIAAGFQAWFAKPIEIDELVAAIASATAVREAG